VRTVREDCLDHLLVFSRRHLEVILTEYVRHYNAARPHRGLGLEQPLLRPAPSAPGGRTIRHDVLGGLVHVSLVGWLRLAVAGAKIDEAGLAPLGGVSFAYLAAEQAGRCPGASWALQTPVQAPNSDGIRSAQVDQAPTSSPR
jgi:hypothetical protein